ncbi:hypothetical protein [Nocardia sp. NPDC052566]|uniref:hypothetical protein n=1 Tax=Nocardia sp. NPDC052566 TaxID=3364330 RepID=UPI0037CB9053
MSTAISENATKTTSIDDVDDLGFDTVPRVAPARRGATRALESLHRPAVDRPRGVRPRAAVVAYDERPARIVAPASVRELSPMARVQEAQAGFAMLAMAALLSALVVTALICLAHWRAGTFDGGVPATVPVVVDGSVDSGAPSVYPPR